MTFVNILQAWYNAMLENHKTLDIANSRSLRIILPPRVIFSRVARSSHAGSRPVVLGDARPEHPNHYHGEESE